MTGADGGCSQQAWQMLHAPSVGSTDAHAFWTHFFRFAFCKRMQCKLCGRQSRRRRERPLSSGGSGKGLPVGSGASEATSDDATSPLRNQASSAASAKTIAAPPERAVACILSRRAPPPGAAAGSVRVGSSGRRHPLVTASGVDPTIATPPDSARGPYSPAACWGRSGSPTMNMSNAVGRFHGRRGVYSPAERATQ
eukprot:7263400-Prymnesium_polylepis.2